MRIRTPDELRSHEARGLSSHTQYDRFRSYEAAIESIDLYISHRAHPGSQTMAMLENDLREAFGCADDIRRTVIFSILNYLWNDVDFRCWGSKERVAAWLAGPKS